MAEIDDVVTGGPDRVFEDERNDMHRQPHILNAATNLLGICFVIIGGLKFTQSNKQSYADEIAWLAALLLLTSTINAYLAIRNNGARPWQGVLADWSFIGGVLALAISVVVAAVSL